VTPVFADTSFYQALLNPTDRWHDSAVLFSETYAGTIVTTEYVLVELGALLSHRSLRRIYVEFVQQTQADPDTLVLPASGNHFANGFRLFTMRHDKNWSMTDCISFAVMEHMGIKEAVSCDKHFEQAGYRPLLGPP